MMWSVVYWGLLGYSGLVALYGIGYIPYSEKHPRRDDIPDPSQVWIIAAIMFVVLALVGLLR